MKDYMSGVGQTENFKYLKSDSYYSDRYDRCTIGGCRLIEKIHGKRHPGRGKKTLKGVVSEMALYFALFTEKGERYLEKEKTIQKWMERDRKQDELLASAQPPEDIRCLTCRGIMTLASKDLYNWGPDGKDRVLFMYDCPNGCRPSRAFFDNGEEYRPKPHLCLKCNNAMGHTDKRLKDKIITTYTCSRCGHKEKDELDLSPKKEEIDKDFVKDRERFCLTEEEGKKYLEQKMQLEQLGELVNRIKEEKKKEGLRDKLAKIKKLPVAGLQGFLTPVLEREGYIKLDFSKPEMEKGVIVPFTVQDNKTDRGEYDSRIQLQRILKKILETTNWRLMSDGVSYRLGILTGRLRGYESEEDLLKITDSNNRG